MKTSEFINHLASLTVSSKKRHKPNTTIRELILDDLIQHITIDINILRSEYQKASEQELPSVKQKLYEYMDSLLNTLGYESDISIGSGVKPSYQQSEQELGNPVREFWASKPYEISVNDGEKLLTQRIEINSKSILDGLPFDVPTAFMNRATNTYLEFIHLFRLDTINVNQNLEEIFSNPEYEKYIFNDGRYKNKTIFLKNYTELGPHIYMALMQPNHKLFKDLQKIYKIKEI